MELPFSHVGAVESKLLWSRTMRNNEKKSSRCQVSNPPHSINGAESEMIKAVNYTTKWREKRSTRSLCTKSISTWYEHGLNIGPCTFPIQLTAVDAEDDGDDDDQDEERQRYDQHEPHPLPL